MESISRAIIVIAIVAVAASTSAQTPAGGQLLSHTFEEGSAATADPGSHKIEVPLPDEKGDATVTFEVQTGKADGGLMLRQLDGTVDESGGWTITAAEPSPPINLGTADAPVMAVTVIITRHRKEACAEHARQTSVTIKADGTHNVD